MRQPHKMVQHTQTIRRLLPANCLNVFDHFVGLARREINGLTLNLFRILSFNHGNLIPEIYAVVIVVLQFLFKI